MKPWAQAQIAAALKAKPAKGTKAKGERRTAPQGDSLVRCCTEGCEFPPTASVDAMDRHCDSAGHHRYEMVLS